MTFKLGLTGSIGMGKSTTAALFAQEGCAVWDADAAVHRLYAKGGAAVVPISEAFPSAVVDAAVERSVLKDIIAGDPTALGLIEKIVHPLVGEDRANFLAAAKHDIVVLDVPLLFETGGQARVDATVVVFTDSDTQRTRVLARRTMTDSQFALIKAKQMPSEEKVALADYTVKTDTVENAAEQVRQIVADIREKLEHA